MVAHADVLDAYRRYPHIDSAETGIRTARLLLDIVESRNKPRKAFRQLDFLIPINGGCTDFGPACEIYFDVMPRIERETPGLKALSFAPGFPLADIRDVGPSVVAYAETQQAADQAAARVAAEVTAREPSFRPAFHSADAAVAKALEIARKAAKPVVIADTQDNPGGGGPGDTTGLLRALISHRAKGAAIGAIIDPETAAAAARVGAGNSAVFAIGGKRMPGDAPVSTRCRVLAANERSWKGSGAMKAGMTVNLGRIALLETLHEGVLIAVASRAAQILDRSIFAHLGLVPEELPIIAVKSSVHFRADFAPLAAEIIVAVAPGPVAIDHDALTYRKIRPGVRLMPRA
jgi:microcystin degradation protein MlrC